MLDRLEPERFRRGLEQTRCAAERLKRMVGDLADVSQLDTKRLPLRPEAIELVALASLVVERHQAATSDRTIVLRTAGVVPRVWADPVRVEQVFDNLLCNALKYSPPGPTVRVEVLPAHGEVVVTVSNLGPGIRAADLPKIFDRYYRTPAARAGAADGLGLGLYIAKGLVESQGGHISAESVPGEVTTFRFTLPFVREVA
jgi:signal transduction histidine kinase